MTIEQLPSGSWRVSVQVNGNRIRETLPRGASKRDAVNLEAELRAEAGRNPARGTTLVVELLDRHLEDHDYAPTSLADLKLVRAKIPDWFLTTKVRDVTPAMVDSLYRQLLRDGWTPYRIRRVHELLGSAWNLARRYGWSSLAPTRDARPPKLPKKEVSPPDPEQVRLLLASAGTEIACALRVLAVTGMRRGELCGLHWEDVDLESGALQVRRSVAYTPASGVYEGEGKTGAKGHRVVQLDPLTLEQLRSLHRGTVSLARSRRRFPGPYVFSFDVGDTPWRPDFVTRRFGQLRDELGLKGVRLHDIRHYVATQMIASGVDPTTAAGVLGHASPETTLRVYAHYLPARGAAAVQAIAEGLDQ